MTKSTTVSKLLSLLLVVVMLVGIIPTAFAATTKTAAKEGTVTEQYNDTDGHVLATSETSDGDSLSAIEIEDYEYTGYEETVENVYSREHLQYIIGYPERDVRPENNLRRSEAIMIFYRMSVYYAEWDGSYAPTHTWFNANTFSDISVNDYYYEALEYLYNCGKVDGYQDGTFRPNEPITRGELATLAAKFEGLSWQGNSNKFSDVTTGAWDTPYINAAADRGWVKGYPDGTFRPNNYITRAEAITLINRVLDQIMTASELTALGISCPYWDLAKTHWAYADIMEATLKHDTVTWHGTSYNAGDINVMTEYYVDGNGNEIADPVVTAIKANYHPRSFDGYAYYGQIVTRTYIYKTGKVDPTVAKTVNKTTANVGDTLTYTITLNNSKNATTTWTNVVVTDRLNTTYLDFVDGSVYINNKATSDYTFKSGVLTVNVGDIGVNETVTVKFKAEILNAAYGKTISNSVTAKSDNYRSITDDSPNVDVNQGDILPYIDKASNVSTASVGDTIKYTITVGNDENATYAWDGVTVTDEIPAGLDFVDGSVYIDSKSTNAYAYKNGTLTVDLGEIEPGAEYQIRFSAVVNEAAYNTVIKNTAIADGDNADPVEATDPGTAVNDGAPDPSFAKSANQSSASVGDTLVYTFTLSNSRYADVAWTDIVITDAIPSYLDFQRGSVEIGGKAYTDYSYSALTGILTIYLDESIEPGDSMTVTFEAVVNESAYGQTVTNYAVAASSNNPDLAAEDKGVVISDGEADFSATKTVSKTTANVGDTVTYTILLSNGRKATTSVDGVIVTDTLDKGLDFVSGSLQVNGFVYTDYGYHSSTRLLTVNIGSIAPDTDYTITFQCKVNDSAMNSTISNVAVVQSDGNRDKDVPSDDITVGGGAAAGSLTKTVNKSTAQVGDTLTYSLRATNSTLSADAWKGVILTDTIPEGLSYVEGSIVSMLGTTLTSVPASYNTTTRVLTANVGDIPVGTSAVITFKVTVDDGMQGKSVYNTAIAKGDDGVEYEGSDSGTVIDSGTVVPLLTKTSTPSEVTLGDTIQYTITATNKTTATESWKNVVISDTIPTGLTFIYGSCFCDGGYCDYGVSGNTLNINLGDIAPGDTYTITFMVRADTVGSYNNTAVASSTNAPNVTASDNGVTVNPIPNTTGGEDGDNPYNFTAKKTTDAETVSAGDTYTYKIVVANPASNQYTWYDVVINDPLDTSRYSYVRNSCYINGVQASDTKAYTNNGSLVIKVGDVTPGQTVTVTFDVLVFTTAQDSTINNTAYITGSIDEDGNNPTTIETSATPVYVQNSNILIDTTYHVQLFAGYGSAAYGPSGTLHEAGEWAPNEYLTRREACLVFYRSLINPESITYKTVPSDVAELTEQEMYDACMYAYSKGALSLLSDGTLGVRSDQAITMDELAKVAYVVGGVDLSVSGSGYITRYNLALKLVEPLRQGNTNPNYGVYSSHLPIFNDVTINDSRYPLIAEMSTSHSYELDTSGTEYWTSLNWHNYNGSYSG